MKKGSIDHGAIVLSKGQMRLTQNMSLDLGRQRAIAAGATTQKHTITAGQKITF
jgi:hypothetical protein